jgi:DNA-binding YbaB/EbfC family protein
MNINPIDLIKNAQKIQEQMGSIQEKLAVIHEKGSAGGGMVEIELSGRMDLCSVRISPEAVEDIQMLEDLIKAAYVDANEKVQAAISRELGVMAGGLNLGIRP